MVKRSKMPKLKVPSLGGLTKNKYVLYFLVIVGLMNVVNYLQQNNLDSLGLFVIGGVLTTFFTKNMIVALAVAILAGMCKTCTNYLAVSKFVEGFQEGNEVELNKYVEKLIRLGVFDENVVQSELKAIMDQIKIHLSKYN